ncbi:ABC transporter permease [Aureimonas altamirensis]|uniref:ABC transporter permease n=1 Tax=Aureimonas altamirensis TaxID=370622 RepID=UPI00255798E1|nr:ABC transporter permease [Aureimonas altamirensis]
MTRATAQHVLITRGGQSPAQRLGDFFSDLRNAIAMRELWLFLGWRDVRRLYQRSVLGPLWLTLSMGVMVGGLGLLYSQIFGMDVSTYLPFLAIGLIMWGFIGSSINTACTVFTAAAGSVRQIHLPLMVYVLQFTWAQLITFAHNMLIYLIVVILFGINPGWTVLLFIPALFLITLNVAFCAMILGPFSARFRDMPMIVQSITQVTFFMTPILWSATQLPERAVFVHFNPFYHFIEIARDPLLGGTGTVENWVVASLLTLTLGVVATLFFARFRARIAYWA